MEKIYMYKVDTEVQEYFGNLSNVMTLSKSRWVLEDFDTNGNGRRDMIYDETKERREDGDTRDETTSLFSDLIILEQQDNLTYLIDNKGDLKAIVEYVGEGIKYRVFTNKQDLNLDDFDNDGDIDEDDGVFTHCLCEPRENQMFSLNPAIGVERLNETDLKLWAKTEVNGLTQFEDEIGHITHVSEIGADWYLEQEGIEKGSVKIADYRNSDRGDCRKDFIIISTRQDATIQDPQLPFEEGNVDLIIDPDEMGSIGYRFCYGSKNSSSRMLVEIDYLINNF